MKIGIDGFSLIRKDSGIEVYARELVLGVARGAPVELYAPTRITFDGLDNVDINVRSSNLESPGTLRKLKWELIDVSGLISPEVSIYHTPHFILPYRLPNLRKVVTVHDLAFMRHPEFFDWKTRAYYHLFLRRSLALADAIICISKSCMEDLKRYFPSVSHKSHLVYNGFRDFSRVPADDSIFEILNLNSPYLLTIGTLNARKNLEGSIKAYKRVAEKRDIDLVIVGAMPKHDLPVPVNDRRIHVTGFISDAHLAALYRNAELFLFPSFYEGFGFPILEAMSCGLPVVTSDVSSMPEVSGYPSELLCDPSDVNSIFNLIESILLETSRAKFREHAKLVTARFSWNKMVEETIGVYEALQENT